MPSNENIYWLYFRAFEFYRLTEHAVQYSDFFESDEQAIEVLKTKAENLQQRYLRLRNPKFPPARRYVDRIEYAIIKNGDYVNGQITGSTTKTWTWYAPTQTELMEQAVDAAWKMLGDEEVKADV